MPNTYGFRSYPPKALPYTNKYTGAVIATPVLDILMRQDGGVVTDRSAYGNNGVCSGCVGARGVFDEGQKFDGVNDTINCGSNPSLDIGGDISGCAWAKVDSVAATHAILDKRGGATGWGFYVNPVGLLYVYFRSGPSAVVAASSIFGRCVHAGFTVSGLICRVFVDGLQEARDVCDPTDDPATSLCVGSFQAGGNWLTGLIELPQVFSGALSPEQVYRKYLEAREVPIYSDDFSSYAVTPVAKAAGSMCGPFRVLANTALIVVDATGKRVVRNPSPIVLGYLTLPAASAAERSCASGSFGTVEFDVVWGVNIYCVTPWAQSVDAYTAGDFIFSISTFGAVTVGAYAWANDIQTVDGYFTTNVKYRLRIVRRIGRQTTLYVKGGAYPDWALVSTVGGAGTNPCIDSATPTGNNLVIHISCSGEFGDLYLSRVCERPASFPWEFSTGTYAGVVSGLTVWMRCLTAGVTMTPKDLDWQTAVFSAYKGADANVTDVLFVASEIGGTTFANQNGYVLRLAADESVQLIRTTGGIEAAPTAQTAAGFVSITTEYEFKITHNGTTNAYEFFVRGGAYATWTLMFAATLGIHTSSNYWCNDLDAGDRINAPAYYLDIRTA